MPTMHRTDFGELMLRQTDTEWFDMQHAEMRAACHPLSPALFSILWFNQRIRQAMCNHL